MCLSVWPCGCVVLFLVVSSCHFVVCVAIVFSFMLLRFVCLLAELPLLGPHRGRTIASLASAWLPQGHCHVGVAGPMVMAHVLPVPCLFSFVAFCVFACFSFVVRCFVFLLCLVATGLSQLPLCLV